jgi:hypothetical protein
VSANQITGVGTLLAASLISIPLIAYHHGSHSFDPYKQPFSKMIMVSSGIKSLLMFVLYNVILPVPRLLIRQFCVHFQTENFIASPFILSPFHSPSMLF